MASMFGASALTDAFNVAFRIPNLFRRLFAEGAFAQAFVPVLANHQNQRRRGGHAPADRCGGHRPGLDAAVDLHAGCAGAPALVGSGQRHAPNPEAFDAAVLMTRWMFPYIGFMSMVALAAGILNTWKHFAVPAASPVLLNLCMIGAAWLGRPSWRRAASSPFTPWQEG